MIPIENGITENSQLDGLTIENTPKTPNQVDGQNGQLDQNKNQSNSYQNSKLRPTFANNDNYSKFNDSPSYFGLSSNMISSNIEPSAPVAPSFMGNSSTLPAGQFGNTFDRGNNFASSNNYNNDNSNENNQNKSGRRRGRNSESRSNFDSNYSNNDTNYNGTNYDNNYSSTTNYPLGLNTNYNTTSNYETTQNYQSNQDYSTNQETTTNSNQTTAADDDWN